MQPSGLARAKHCYKQRIEEHFKSYDPRHKWQVTRTVTNIKPPSFASLSFPRVLAQLLLRSLWPWKWGGHPQSRSTAWWAASHALHLRCLLHPWPHTKSLCRGAGRGLYGHFLSVPGQGSCPHKFQDHRHRASGCHRASGDALVPVAMPSTATAPGTNPGQRAFEKLVLSHLKSNLPTALAGQQNTPSPWHSTLLRPTWAVPTLTSECCSLTSG